MKKIITIFLTVLTLTACTLIKQDPEARKKAEIAEKMTEWCEKKSTLAEETLTDINLSKNPIKNKTCPVKPESVCAF